MSKAVKYFICLILISISVLACKKNDANEAHGFVTVLDHGDDLITKSCVQLSDGSFFIAGIQQSDSSSVLAKLSRGGSLVWQKILSGDFKSIQHMLAQDDGTVLIAAFDSLNINKNFVLGRLDGNGQVINLYKTPHNPGPKSDYYSAEIAMLKNGQIACLTQGSIEAFNWYTYPRLIVLDKNLSVLSDKTYKDSFSKDFVGLYKLRLRQAEDSKIVLTGNYQFRNVAGQRIDAYGVIMNINPLSYELTNYHYLTQEPGQFPGESQLMANGNICFTQAPMKKNMSLGGLGEFLSYSWREYYSVGKEICMRELKTDGTLVQQRCFNNFPKLGTAIKMIKLRDGGFVIAGLCNYEDFSASNMNVMLVRISNDLNQKWIRIFKSSDPTFVSDLIETTDGGFALACFMKSFGNQSKMMMIKTNSDGN